MSCTTQIWCLAPTEILEHTFGIISALSAAVIALAAWIGKNSLKTSADQQRFKREMDHAERILIATYNARKALLGINNCFDIIVNLRSEVSGSGSLAMSDDPSDPMGTSVEIKILLERVKDEEIHNNNVIECIPIALSISERDVHDALGELSTHFFHVIAAARYFTKFEKGDKGTEKIRFLFDKLFGEKDENSNRSGGRVDIIVETIESRCLKILHRDKGSRS